MLYNEEYKYRNFIYPNALLKATKAAREIRKDKREVMVQPKKEPNILREETWADKLNSVVEGHPLLTLKI